MAEEHNGDWDDRDAQNSVGAEGVDGTDSANDREASTANEQPTVSMPAADLGNSDTLPTQGGEYTQRIEQLSSEQSVDGNDADDVDGKDSDITDQHDDISASDQSSEHDGVRSHQPYEPNFVMSSPTQTLPTQSTDSPTQTISSASPASSAGSSDSPTQTYRPAPQYGAYGSVPTDQNREQSNAQRPASYGNGYGAPHGQSQQQGSFGSRNPYYSGNPFANPNGSNPYSYGTPQNVQNNQNGQTSRDGRNAQNAGNGQGPQGPGFPPQGPFMGQPNNGGNANTARTKTRKSLNSVWVAVVAALVTAALCLGVGYAAISNGWVTAPTSSSLSSIGSNSSSNGSATVKGGDAADWTSVSKSVSGSVVAIQAQVSDGIAAGSGAIFDTKGDIVTNNHVITGAEAIQVTLSNGQMYSAQVVGTDTTTDLAVIKLDNPPSDLKAVEFADSDSLAVGESVMAIGNPLGYDDTATTGIVSALDRPVSVMDENKTEIVTNAIQIDAAINPGNSGGPTFNAAGQVVGINSSIASMAQSSSSDSSSGSIGIGFAIPANLVKRVANEIIDNGSVKHVTLGVTIASSTATADGVTRGSAEVQSVVSGSAAEKAGLKKGDNIVAFDGKVVSNLYSVLGYVRAAALGDTAKLTVVRDSKTIEIDVTLDQQESSVSGSNKTDPNEEYNNDGNSQGDSNSDGNSNGNSGNGDSSDPFSWLW